MKKMKNKIAKIFLGIGVGLLAAGLHVMLTPGGAM